MNEKEFGVLCEQVNNLNIRIERGFLELKELFNNNSTMLSNHVKEDKENHTGLDEKIQDLRIEMAKTKERWLLFGVFFSIGIPLLIESIVHIFSK